jgi:cytochrome c oxidase assembly factor CtaG
MDISALLSGLVSWPYLLTVLGVLTLALLYGLGARRLQGHDRLQRLHPWNYLAFAAGLLVVLAVLHPALYGQAHRSFWAHMVENEALAVPAAILLMLGMPFWALWYLLPQQARGAYLRWALRQGWPRQVWHRVSQWLLGPWVILAIYLISFSVWHVPPIYDAALQSRPLYALELIMFLGTGLLLWGQMIPLRPGSRARLSPVQSLVCISLVGMHSSFLGSLYMFATAPYYPNYIATHSSASSALVDQHLAGAAMDAPGTVLFAVALFVFLWLWLSEDERAGQSAATPVSPAAKP